MKNIILLFIASLFSISSFAVGAISGSSTVCLGAPVSLSDSTLGGTWSSNDSLVATVNPSGVVTGVSAGTVIISYAAEGGYQIITMTVESAPSPIAGPSTLCAGAGPSSYSDGTTGGGTWTSPTLDIVSTTSNSASVAWGGGVSGLLYFTDIYGCKAFMVITVQTPPCGDGVNNVTSPNTDLTLFPNPVTNELTISWDEPITDISITDLLGKAVGAPNNANGTKMVQINVADLPAGVYFVKINGVEVRKFVKE